MILIIPNVHDYLQLTHKTLSCILKGGEPSVIPLFKKNFRIIYLIIWY